MGQTISSHRQSPHNCNRYGISRGLFFKIREIYAKYYIPEDDDAKYNLGEKGVVIGVAG